jgi:hypothetical protein
MRHFVLFLLLLAVVYGTRKVHTNNDGRGVHASMDGVPIPPGH